MGHPVLLTSCFSFYSLRNPCAVFMVHGKIPEEDRIGEVAARDGQVPPEALVLLFVAHDDPDDFGEAVPGGVARLGHAVVGVKEQRNQRRVHVLREGGPVRPRGVPGQLAEGSDGRGAVPLPTAVEERPNLHVLPEFKNGCKTVGG